MPRPSPISRLPSAIRPPPINPLRPLPLFEASTALRARNLVDQRLNLVGGTLLAEETQDDADGFFSDSFIDAGLCSQLLNQFVHIAPPSVGC
jgi:hypothetical protein